ncbi:DUF2147 domain-containing protein [Geomonas sp. Red32]|uniref:DUF2147 domain-containing protein n=1 Tax=Geomonas sp. Red32 TaxID=2912856 RepID=UPI00202CAC1D|nr:DUF2147 domain-containing protein [Geomonas sp. Red32]MCM0082174.1 DUF2147 domain-containing protein [Geomonas sp. Red32]
MRTALLIPACLLLTSSAWAADTGAITGRWTTEKAKSTVLIYRCGEKYCAKIEALKDPLYTDASEGPPGTPRVDSHNPEPSHRKRSLVGLQFMEGFTPAGDGKLANGTIYDPENGKTYRCTITLKDPHRLDVRGFIGISLFGRTTVWTR